MVVIAMTREIGSHGREVAAGVAEKLGLTVVDRDLLVLHIRSASGIEETLIDRFLEADFLSVRERWRVRSSRLQEHTYRQIYKLASKDNAIIRGWGAAQLLADIREVFCVRVCAPIPVRVSELVARENAAAAEAEHRIYDGHQERCPGFMSDKTRTDAMKALRKIMRSDAAHSAATKHLLRIDWRDATNYDLVLNTARLGIPDCIAQIVHLAKDKGGCLAPGAPRSTDRSEGFHLEPSPRTKPAASFRRLKILAGERTVSESPIVEPYSIPDVRERGSQLPKA